MKQFNSEKTIFLIDGSSFLYRAYYGVKPLHTPNGEPVQAVYSFVRMIKKLADQYRPGYLAIVWDSKGETPRHHMYSAYKATRQDAPADIFDQKARIQEFAALVHIQQVEQVGAEADDLMYSLAKDFKNEYTIVLVTADKDMGQCIDDRVLMLDTFKEKLYDKAAFEEKMEFPIDRLPLYFALLGDASDNIPGVRGIGKKGATDLAQQFTSLEDLYTNLDKVPRERTRTLLLESKANAFLSRDLFLLHYYNTNSTIEDLSFSAENWSLARPLFEELNFTSLLKEMGISPLVATKPLSQAKQYQFVCVTDEATLEKVCKEITTAGHVALDTELDGLNPLQNKLIGISLCTHKGIAYYIPFGHDTEEVQLDQAYVTARLKPLLQDASIKKYLHHAKFDMLALHNNGITLSGLAFDTLIAAQLVTEDWQKIGLKALSQFYLNETMLTFSDVVTNNGYHSFDNLPLALATEYAAADAHQTLQLVHILEEKLKSHQMLDLYYTIELPMVTILFGMEARGIYCDTTVLAQLNVHVSRDLEELKNNIISLIGDTYKDVNLNSPKQIGIILFEELKLAPVKKTGKKTAYSTDAEVLQELGRSHPVPALILRYRELFKLKSTYIDALPNYINPYTNRIHTTFSQTAVATGRLSSFDPNLQNIPTDSALYEGLSIRAAFKPDPGCVFLSADYSQIELRVLAYLSQDRTLVDAFAHNTDIHAQTAARLFETIPDKVTSEQRQFGKRINFSVLYGLTPYGLSKDLGIPFKDAKLYIDRYFEQYPTVSQWMEQVIQETKEHGYVTTCFSRRRYIPGIYEHNKTLYEAARRIAINTKAQGTAAEIMKKGMIELEAALRKQGLRSQLVLQIHDELLLMVPHEEQPIIETIVHNVLESVVAWNVPLVVTTRYGTSWQNVTK